MDINFDNKDEKHYSSLSEINRLKRDLSPENCETKENKNNSMNLKEKFFDINEFNKQEEKIKILKNEKENEDKIEEKLDNSNNQKNSKDENDNNNIKSLNNSKLSNEQKEKNNNENIHMEDEEKQENPIEEEEKKQDLIPLWYKCLNKDHGEKYITLDRKKKGLICKNCYNSGALETNLELNQEFIDNYLKEQEQKNISHESPKDIIKEAPEESNPSESEENKDNLNISEENKSNKSKNIKICLTFQCENYPYYYCEPCQGFICYHCIMQKMDERTDKSRHYYHDIESVNYESNSFKDDIKLELETINKINLSLDYLIKNEKEKNKKLLRKLKNENQNDLLNYIANINKNLNILISEDIKSSYDKYIEKAFNNKDNNIKDLEISTLNTKSKIEKALEELKEIKDLINKKDISNEDKCDLHQKSLELIKNANELIKKGSNVILQSNEDLCYLNNENIKTKIEEQDSLSNQLLLEKEKSFIQSLSNNSKKQGCYKLNRYNGYKHDGLKLFCFTSVELISHTDIILYGLCLCGKYLSSKKRKQLDYSTIPKEDRGFFNINIKLFEKDKKETLINENQKLYEVVNNNDPVIEIFFEKGIKLIKEVKYIIVVENLENEKYSNIWVGNVHKKFVRGNKQSIRCNNTGNIFNFYMPQEHQSDFNEFEIGIIEGILYGN